PAYLVRRRLPVESLAEASQLPGFVAATTRWMRVLEREGVEAALAHDWAPPLARERRDRGRSAARIDRPPRRCRRARGWRRDGRGDHADDAGRARGDRRARVGPGTQGMLDRSGDSARREGRPRRRRSRSAIRGE